MAISDDDGINWTASLPSVGRGNVQPAIIEKSDGSLIAYMRDNGDEPGKIMVSSSNDEGFTWSPAEKIELPNPGASIDAIKLKSGYFLMIYNDVDDGRHSLAVSISEDEGRTWRYTRSIENTKKGEGAYAYPTVIQSEDGKIHATFSYHVKENKTIKYVSFTEEWVKEK
jgi:predicted neuraminidase